MFSLLSKYLPCLPALATTLQKSIRCHCSQFISKKNWWAENPSRVFARSGDPTLLLLVTSRPATAHLTPQTQTYFIPFLFFSFICQSLLQLAFFRILINTSKELFCLITLQGKAVFAMNRTVAPTPPRRESHITHAECVCCSPTSRSLLGTAACQCKALQMFQVLDNHVGLNINTCRTNSFVWLGGLNRNPDFRFLQMFTLSRLLHLKCALSV